MKTISAEWLEANKACSDQVRLFRDTFGDGPVLINVENWEKARKVRLLRFWLVRFLKGMDRAEYDLFAHRARAEYDRVCDAAHAEWQSVCDTALFTALTKDTK